MVQTFNDVIESIFGQYEPCIVTDASGSIIDTCTNFGYIACVVLFLVVLLYVLKTIGGLIYEWLR